MRKFQRAAVVAAAVAGLSTLGVGVSFAGGYDAPGYPTISAVANSQANALATWGGPDAHGYAAPEAAPTTQEAPKYAAPEGYGQAAAPESYGSTRTLRVPRS
jgi:hypothetical protein